MMNLPFFGLFWEFYFCVVGFGFPEKDFLLLITGSRRECRQYFSLACQRLKKVPKVSSITGSCSWLQLLRRTLGVRYRQLEEQAWHAGSQQLKERKLGGYGR